MMVIGLLAVAAIPSTIGTCQAVSQKNRQEAEAKRAAKFNLKATIVRHGRTKESYVILQDGKLILDYPRKVGHRFTGYYFKYPSEEGFEGLVSTISDDPPMLNWIYVDRESLQVRYGTRSDSMGNIIGPWSWSEDEQHLTLEDWQGFVAVKEGSDWILYYDSNGDWSGLPEDCEIVDVDLRRILIEAS